MTAPAVSVIIPAYNYGKFIIEGISSLQRQSFADFECIVVDDGSTDDTRAVVQQLAAADRRIRYVFQSNSGQPSARNRGIDLASGRYLQFLDADDLLQPEKFAIQVDFLDQHPSVSVVYGAVFYFRDTAPEDFFVNRWDGRDKEWMPGTEGEGEPVIRAFVSGNIFELGCAMFRTETVCEAGYFTNHLKGVEDYDFCFRLALKNKSFAFLKLPGSATLMRHHPGSFSKSLLTMYQQELKLRLGFTAELRKLYPELVVINEARFHARLRQLLDLMIDLRRKKQIPGGQKELLNWIWSVTSAVQKIYFFPRWVKAGITSYSISG